MRRRSGATLAVCGLLLSAAATVVIVLGLQPRVVAESLASSRFSHWNAAWRASDRPTEIRLGQDLLPSNLPGPADIWAGSRAHALAVTFDAEPGNYTLVMSFYEAHEFQPPRLSLDLNARHLADLRLRPGGGQRAPYDAIRKDLTVEVTLPITIPRNSLVITNTEGSWAAPAKLRLARGWTFSPAKAAYFLLARNRYLVAILGLLGGVAFCWMLSRGVKEAVAALLLVTLSFLFTAAVCEFLFRAYLVRSPDRRVVTAAPRGLGEEAGQEYFYATMVEPNPEPDILYTLKPNLDGSFLGHALKTNSQGMRGPEVSREKIPGVPRILGLGDSVMMGWGVSYEEAALTQIGEAVGQRLDQRIETLNLGCPSYNTALEVATYRRKGRQYKPDLVILIFMDNDFGFPGLMLEPVDLYALRKSYLKEQLRKTVAAHWPDATEEEQAQFISTRHLSPLRGKKASELDAHERWLKAVEAYYTRMVGQDAVGSYLKDLGDMLREDGASGLVVYNPITLTVGDPASYEKHAGFVTVTAKNAGMETLNMTSVYEAHLRRRGLRRMEDGLWLNARDWHPNAAAHRLIAHAVIEHLERTGQLTQLRHRAS